MNKQPVIIIYYDKDTRLLREVKAGIEEESVYYEVLKYEGLNCEALASEASRNSLLGIGIGIRYKEINLSVDKISDPLIKVPNAELKEARLIGCNAARYAKGLPLK
ncbi:glycerol dehydratase reactivase beta/small subunit family protein [Vallitalea okinawensis]|uniref:glycerol dehydratase reactivase beta/small subunit family protein n=1 Tax=Vallitalea okinawensis TaxID=2078660 RepID=UPI0013005385|nr:glycerol dehydratase reactivase beta/small subunit family protein [Vallitalea okinawensis]